MNNGVPKIGSYNPFNLIFLLEFGIAISSELFHFLPPEIKFDIFWILNFSSQRIDFKKIIRQNTKLFQQVLALLHFNLPYLLIKFVIFFRWNKNLSTKNAILTIILAGLLAYYWVYMGGGGRGGERGYKHWEFYFGVVTESGKLEKFR